MFELEITHYTDPGCPWAYSAEPFRRKLSWIYGEQLRWHDRMVVLADSAEQYEAEGVSTQKQSATLGRIRAEHGMPIDDSRRPRMAGTGMACCAVVAARLHQPDRVPRLLRALRVRHFSGWLLDEEDTIAAAADDAGINAADLRAWMGNPATLAELEADKRGARRPTDAALAQNARLASWEGGRRYSCPSYEITRSSDELELTAPGFQPFAVYWALFANLIPSAEQRDLPGTVEAVLEWAGEPLATREVAVVCELEPGATRQKLARVATEQPVGQDGFWSLR